MKSADLHKDYFEGILQIRESTPQLIDWVRKRIIADGKARIAKEKKTTNGIDLYISDQHYLQNLGKKIKEHHGGTITVSTRLHTVHKMTSRHLYRITVLYKPSKFKRGDVIRLYDDQYKIISIGKTITLQNTSTGAKETIKPAELRKASLP